MGQQQLTLPEPSRDLTALCPHPAFFGSYHHISGKRRAFPLPTSQHGSSGCLALAAFSLALPFAERFQICGERNQRAKPPLCHLHTTVALPRCTLKHWQGVGFIPTSTPVSPDEAGVDQARMDKWTREAGAYMPGEQLLLLRCFRKVGRRLMERGISSIEQAEDGSLRK